MINEMFHDLVVLTNDSETFKKNITDRHVVNDSLTTLLEKWKHDDLPLIIDNLKYIPIDFQAKL